MWSTPYGILIFASFTLYVSHTLQYPSLNITCDSNKAESYSALLTLQKGSYLAGILLLLFHIAREIDAVESLFCCIYMNFGYIIQNLNFAVFP